MDLETENRIAAILLREAAELRRQAEKDGVQAYLRKPNVRGRPNSRFLTATVLGVQQANRVVEVDEMWKARRKELEMEKNHGDRNYSSKSGARRYKEDEKTRNKRRKEDSSVSTSYSNKTKEEEVGLNDEDVEKFLHSKVKRGRGSVGSRIDETGPYLPSDSLGYESETTGRRVVLGPSKPAFVKEDERKKKS